MDQSKQIALGITFLISCALILWLLLTKLAWNPFEKDATDTELFFAVLEEPQEEMPDMPYIPPVKGEETGEAAQTPEDANEESRPAPQTGTNLTTQGAVDKPVQTVTQQKPSPVKEVQKPTPSKPAASVDKKAEEEKALAQQTRNQVSNVFANAQNKGNASNGSKDEGVSGKTTGNPTATGGTGTSASVSGQIGGKGWRIPNYSKNIKSNITGSVRFNVEVKKDGSVGKVTYGSTKLSQTTINDCIAEIRRHKFINSDPENAEPTTAYITFTFVDPK